MIDLYNAATNQLLGSVTEADAATIDLLGDGRASDHLLGLLRSALGSSEGVEIRWQRR